MKTAGILRSTGIAAVAGVLSLGAFGVQAANAQSAPPTLTGEHFAEGPSLGGITYCEGTGPFSYTASGTATGPYPGTFTETVTGTANGPNSFNSYTATFTISSAAGDVTGTETLDASGDQSQTCYQDPTNFSVQGFSNYQATIGTPGGDYADQGGTSFETGVYAQSVYFQVEDFTSSQSETTLVPPDLALSDSAPATAASGQPYTYTLIATNNGGSDATGVTLTDTLAGTTHYKAVTTSQGSCTRPAPPKGGTVSCALGTLASGASATITITVTPTKPGRVSDSAQVTAANATPAAASAPTTVQGS